MGEGTFFVARCPEHGLHGCRAECFECGGPVEQVEVVSVRSLLSDESIDRAATEERGIDATLWAAWSESDPMKHYTRECARQILLAALDRTEETQPRGYMLGENVTPEDVLTDTAALLASERVGGDGIPLSFWREVPCGHPPEPVAMRTPGARWVCHCGWLLEPERAISDGIDDGAPGPLVPCAKCGCYVAIPTEHA